MAGQLLAGRNMAGPKMSTPDVFSPAGFGAWLKTLRLARGLKQREVAAAVGMDSSHFGKIEKGTRSPTEAQLAALAACLGVLERDMRLRLAAARCVDHCGGDPDVLCEVAHLVQQQPNPRLPVNNPVN